MNADERGWKRSTILPGIGLVLCLIGVLAVWNEGETAAVKAAPGIAEKYPGDAGIEKDPAVAFAESFEGGTLEDLGKRWSSISNKDGKVLEFSTETPGGSAGRRSLRMEARVPENTGGHLYTVLDEGLDTAYLRFYVKFPEEAGYQHHFVTLLGQRDPKPYPEGRAGQRPEGDQRFSAGIEPFGENGSAPPPGHWNFYTYWCEMKKSGDDRYWGNGLRPERPILTTPGRWQCVEVMLKCNTAPDRRDGELALWTDGVLRAHFKRGAPRGPWTGLGFRLLEAGGEPFEGFLWRTDNAVKLNTLWLLHYVTETALRRHGQEPGRPVPVWFDDIVISREYVGPIRPAG